MFGPKLDHEIESCESLVIHPEKDETKSFKKGPLITVKRNVYPLQKGIESAHFPDFVKKSDKMVFFGHFLDTLKKKKIFKNHQPSVLKTLEPFFLPTMPLKGLSKLQ